MVGIGIDSWEVLEAKQSTIRAAVSHFMQIINASPPGALLLAAVGSYGAQTLAGLQGWPLWAVVGATLAPWTVIISAQIRWIARRNVSLAVLYVLTLTQAGHVLEHVAQMVQIHLLHLDKAHSRGIFGALDIEWVHFTWNTWIILAAVILLSRLPRNRWLWATLVIAAWHESEHAYIMFTYLNTHVAGTPGLLATGGAILGGLPISRPDLHFLYNLMETVPMVGAFCAVLAYGDPPLPSAAALIDDIDPTLPGPAEPAASRAELVTWRLLGREPEAASDNLGVT